MKYTHYTIVMTNGSIATVTAKWLHDKGVLSTTLGQTWVDRKTAAACGIDSLDGFYSRAQSVAHIDKIRPLLQLIAQGGL